VRFSCVTAVLLKRLYKSKFTFVRVMPTLKIFETRKSNWLIRSSRSVPGSTISNIRNGATTEVP
jgi:hypothetical protein